MGELLNRNQDRDKRRALRRTSPLAERLMWQHLRDRRLGGWKFRRQYGIAHYVADFCCVECRLVVELDGLSHEGEDAAEYDLNRQNYLESLGFRVVRFQNEQIYRNINGVLETLLGYCQNDKTKAVSGQLRVPEAEVLAASNL